MIKFIFTNKRKTWYCFYFHKFKINISNYKFKYDFYWKRRNPISDNPNEFGAYMIRKKTITLHINWRCENK